MTIAAATKVAKRLATGPYGYGQDDRTSALADNGKLGVAGLAKVGDSDCSFSTGIIYYLGGLIGRDVLRGTFYTGNLASKLAATGMFTPIKVGGWSLAKLRGYLREGDALVGPGHVVYALGGGKVVSFEATEKGRLTGGRKGDQTGREGRIRDVYSRSKGWAYIVRPIAAEVFAGRVLAAYSAGRSTKGHLAKLIQRSPHDGPIWSAFIDDWTRLDKGMALTYDPAKLAGIPVKGHAFVVLGSALNADGSLTGKMVRRLKLAKAAAARYPQSKIIVTGGAAKAGVTEADAGRKWLVAQGVSAARIIIETKAASTIGNAKFTVPLLRKAKLTTYTLVSDASHLRRAAVHFLAAQLQIETAENIKLGIKPIGALAHDDYSPAPIKTALPVTPDTRQVIAAEVASLLGLTAEYRAAGPAPIPTT